MGASKALLQGRYKQYMGQPQQHINATASQPASQLHKKPCILEAGVAVLCQHHCMKRPQPHWPGCLVGPAKLSAGFERRYVTCRQTQLCDVTQGSRKQPAPRSLLLHLSGVTDMPSQTAGATSCQSSSPAAVISCCPPAAVHQQALPAHPSPASSPGLLNNPENLNQNSEQFSAVAAGLTTA